jgi:hypothetical protein
MVRCSDPARRILPKLLSGFFYEFDREIFA